MKRNLGLAFIAIFVIVLTCLLLPAGGGKTSAQAGAQRDTKSSPNLKLDAGRRLELKQLYSRLRAGDPFSREEIELLTRFAAGDSITELEADTLISRTLYNRYVINNALSKEQESLLDLYSGSVARREHDIADLKFSALEMEMRSAGAAAPIVVKDGASPNVPAVAPANDLCAGAEVIPGAGPFPALTAVTADITEADITGDPPLPSCQTDISRSIWYTFTPTTTANYTISSCANSPTGSTVDDTVIAIYTSTSACGGTFTEIPTAGASVGCDDDSCTSEALQAVISTQLTSGTQYFFVVWKFGPTAPTATNTAVQLRVTQNLIPANDTCAGVIPLTLNIPVDGSNAVAADDYTLSGAGCFTGVGQTTTTAPGRDVVYSFTAPSAGNYSFRVTNATFNAAVYVASTCPAAPATVSTCLGAANRSTVSGDEVDCLPLTLGQQVFVFVDGVTAATGGTFTVEVNPCLSETEPNGTPATANALTCNNETVSSPAADVDFYNLGSPPLGSRVFAMSDGIQANTSDIQFRVTTATDTLEFDDDDGDAPFGVGGFEPVIAGTPLTGVASFLRVNPFSGTITSQPHRLYLAVQPPGAGVGGSSATAETEANDTIGTANSAVNNYFSGTLSAPAPSADLDLYQFSAVAGNLVFLALDCDPLRDGTPIDGALALLDSAGAPLVSVNGSGSLFSTTLSPGTLTGTTPNSPAEGIVYRIRTSGTYYARVSIGTTSSGVTGTGDYLLSISRNCQTGPTAAPATISGRVTDSSGAALGGVTIDLTGASSRATITDANGNYHFDNVETNGFYTVTPTLVNYHFGPESHSFSLLANKTDAIFTATRDAVIVGNAIDTAEYFVRQHYLDFLGREPDESGFNFWSNQILACGGDAACIERRTINVSAAYFLSIEFQQTGGLVDGLYRASYGRAPRYAEFMPDTAVVAQGVVVGPSEWTQRLEANKQAFVAAWVQRAEFRAAYDGLTNDAFVDSLISHTSGGFNGDREALVSGLNSGSMTRAGVLRQVVENEGFIGAKQNEMFVMMEYFGYLRRDPDASGYAFWLNKLNQFGGNFEQAEMVKAFIVSGEYRDRFRQ